MSKMTMIGEIVCGLAQMDTKYVRLAHEIITEGLKGNDGEEMRKQLLQTLRNPSKVTEENSFLAQKRTFELNFSTEITDFGDFFQTSNTLLVNLEFIDCIVAVATAGHLTSFSLVSFNLVMYGSYAEICSELPADHVLSATEGCHVIAHIIKQQADGKIGHLRVNKARNVFYVLGIGGRVFIVNLFMRPGRYRWVLSCRPLENNPGRVGSRVFARNSILKSSEPLALASA